MKKTGHRPKKQKILTDTFDKPKVWWFWISWTNKILRENFIFELTTPGPNSKSISVLGKSKSKSYLGFQYWASLNISLTSLPSLNQDLDNTWKLIPKSKPTFQKKFDRNFRIQKNFATCHDFGITFRPLSRGARKWCRGHTKLIVGWLLAPLEGILRVFQVFWAVFSHFSAVWSHILAENQHIYFRSWNVWICQSRKSYEEDCEGSHAVKGPRFTKLWKPGW